MSIPDFIARCDAYQADAGVTRVWLSKRLFNDTYRLDDLASGKTDVGVKRLERAAADLGVLEDERAKSKVGEDPALSSAWRDGLSACAGELATSEEAPTPERPRGRSPKAA